MERYYFSTDGTDVQGPVSAEILRHLQASGGVSGDRQICREGSDTWQKITPLTKPKSTIPDRVPTSRRSSGKAILILGLCIAGYFFLLFDTSVSVPSQYVSGVGTVGGGRVHNVGLMQERTLGCLAGLAIAVIGVVMIVSDQKKT